MSIDTKKLIDMYKSMVRIRGFEERVCKEFASGNIAGFVHLYTGEEAVAVGVCASLNVDDYITSTHRGHGHLIAKGGKLDRMMAELYCLSSTLSRIINMHRLLRLPLSVCYQTLLIEQVPMVFPE